MLCKGPNYFLALSAPIPVVDLDDHVINPREVQAGVRQDRILAPFNVHLNQINPLEPEPFDQGVKTNSPNAYSLPAQITVFYMPLGREDASAHSARHFLCVKINLLAIAYENSLIHKLYASESPDILFQLPIVIRIRLHGDYSENFPLPQNFIGGNSMPS